MALAVQLVDVRGGAALKAAELRGPGLVHPLTHPIWATIAARYQRLVSVPAFHGQPDRHTMAWFCAEHGLASNIGYFGKMDDAGQRAGARRHEQAVLEGRYAPGSVYTFPSAQLWAIARQAMGPRDLAVLADGHYLIVPEGRTAVGDVMVDDPAPPPPAHDTWLAASTGGPGRDFILDGWWPWGDSWGTWSLGPEARLVLPVPAGRPLRVSLRWLATAPPHRQQSAQVFLDDARTDVTFPVGLSHREDSFEVTPRRPFVVMRIVIAAPVVASGGLGIGLEAVRITPL